VIACGRRDRRTDRMTMVTKLLVAFRNFSNAPKNDTKLQVSDFSLRCVGKLMCSGTWLCVTRVNGIRYFEGTWRPCLQAYRSPRYGVKSHRTKSIRSLNALYSWNIYPFCLRQILDNKIFTKFYKTVVSSEYHDSVTF
jgi:hypothetical protein